MVFPSSWRSFVATDGTGFGRSGSALATERSRFARRAARVRAAMVRLHGRSRHRRRL